MDNPTSTSLDASLLIALEASARTLAREAGTLLLEAFPGPRTVEYKSEGHRDPVTETDRAAEELLKAGIRRLYPHHAIIGEETPETEGDPEGLVWVLDPLDGTTNFLNRYPFFGVSVGVLDRGVPVAGALFISSPLEAGGQVLHARRGGGAFVDGRPVHVSESTEPLTAGLFTVPAGFESQFRLRRPLLQHLGQTRTTGSVVYEMALVSSGVFQWAIFGAPRIWDVAAGVLLAQEAGGQVLVWRGGRRRWDPFSSFFGSGGISPGGDLRQWRSGILVGNASVADLVARNLSPRRRLLWRWLGRLRRRTYRRRSPTSG